jgi:hypothetical protein
MEKLDSKFYGEIRKAKDNTIVPDDQWVVFLIKDDAFWHALNVYHSECIKLGCDQEHCEAVDRLIGRGRKWRQANPTLCKLPGAKGERLLDQERVI